jgi:transposase InsO family protein
MARYTREGEAAFEPRSRRPKTSPNALPAATVALIVELRKRLSGAGLDAGPHTIAWHLHHHHQLVVSVASISRHLAKAGLVEPAPKKRPKSSYLRFEAELPNEMWQSDFTHWPLADGTDTEILTWLDDHSRYALTVTAHHRVTGPIVLNAFRSAVAQHGTPASTLTDNGMVFTTRLAGGRGGRNQLEAELRRLQITQINSTPNHPTTCGKVERFQQTMKKWLRQQPPPLTLADLQTQIDAFVEEYNHHRPHASLHKRTPSVVNQARPKATPGTRTDTHDRVRHDKVDDSGSVTLRVAGRMHHIGIGRTHARTRVIVLVQDLHVRILNAATGELLRDFTLDQSRDYQATGAPKGPKTKKPRTQ